MSSALYADVTYRVPHMRNPRTKLQGTFALSLRDVPHSLTTERHQAGHRQFTNVRRAGPCAICEGRSTPIPYRKVEDTSLRDNLCSGTASLCKYKPCVLVSCAEALRRADAVSRDCARPLPDARAHRSRRSLRPDSRRSRHCSASRTPDRSPRRRRSENGGVDGHGERRRRQLVMVTNRRNRPTAVIATAP